MAFPLFVAVMMYYLRWLKIFSAEALAKVSKNGFFVIPTKVGIQSFQLLLNFVDSRLHGNDDFCKRLITSNNYSAFAAKYNDRCYREQDLGINLIVSKYCKG